MKRILYIKASPMADLSSSLGVTDAFIEAYKKTHPKDKVKELDVFKVKLPAFDGDTIRAKYAILHGKPHSEEQKKAWAKVEKVIKLFKRADKYVMAVPMWNFGIPYRLKQYLDVIIQPGYTFSFSPQEGYKGMVTGKQALVVYARGGEYPAGSPMEGYDMQKKYMDIALGFMGFTNVKSIIVEPTLAGPDVEAVKKTAAIAEARKLAENF